MSQKLLNRVSTEGNPLIDDHQVTFVWEGDQAPDLMGDFTDWEESPLQMVKTGDKVWTCVLEFPPDSYIEYSFFNPEKDERYVDPYNSRNVDNGTGELNNYFWMPDLHKTDLIHHKESVSRGTVTEHELSMGFGYGNTARKVWLYKPPVEGQVPLLLVYDGNDFYSRGGIVQVVDNLIAQKRIQPIAMAMVSHGEDQRFLEYGCSDITLGVILEHILPFAHQNLEILDLEEHPGSYGVMGASMGGVMSLYTALRIPKVFGKVLSLSGAFGMEKDLVVYDLVRYLPLRPIEVWMAVGRYEWLLETNRKMHPLLLERGYRAEYMEYNGGHNYTIWRNVYYQGLEYLFGNKP